MNRNFKNIAIASTMLLAMTACSHENDIENQKEVYNKMTYAENFAKQFPNVSLNQSWDYSTGGFQLTSRTRGEDISIQQIPGLDFGVEFNREKGIDDKDRNKITKNQDIYNAIFETLPDTERHEGKSVVLVAPSSSFYIFPLSYQGYWTHDLYVKVGDEAPVKVYEKEIENFAIPYANGMHDLWGWDRTANMPGIKIQAPVGTPVQIYIDNIINHGANNGAGERYELCGTTNSQAIYVDFDKKIDLTLPAGYDLKDDAVIKFIGIEDARITSWTDQDYNDVVLAVIGDPDVPEEVIIQNDQYTVPMSVGKRYFIEDLGSLDDFDFNDIVVDVFQDYTILHKVTITNGQITSDVAGDPVAAGQHAIVRALGGTIDIELKIGDTTWKKSSKFSNYTEMINTATPDYNKKLDVFDVTGWDSDANNVSVKVEEPSGSVYTVEFPGYGTAPMIIAKDINKKWQAERQKVTEDWFSND